MNTPFGPSFGDLELADVRAFILEPRSESLPWEAKGSGVTPKDVREAVCAFANGYSDGYLVLGLGAVTDDDEKKRRRAESCNWKIEGWEPPGGDPEAWITGCIGGTIDPRPHFEVKPFSIEPTKWLAVIRIAPSPLPPCITTEGLIFERLPGVTQKVRTSETLRALHGRGTDSRIRAESNAAQSLTDFWERTAGLRTPARMPQLAVCVAAPSLVQDDLTRTFRMSLADKVLHRLPGTGHGYSDRSTDVEGLTVWSWNLSGETFAARVYVSGCVAFSHCGLYGEDGLSAVAHDGSPLGPMWANANAIARELGAAGPSFVRVRGWDLKADGTYGVKGDFDTWSSVDRDPTSDELAQLRRQAARRSGLVVWEPET